MRKDIPNYPISLYSVETNNGYEWVAKYPDILGCVGGGNTPEEALKEAKINLKVYLDLLDEDNLPYPAINNNEIYNVNGKVSLRISKDLHVKLKKYAEINDTSINQICVEAISEKIGMLNTVEKINSYIKSAIKPLDSMINSVDNIFNSQIRKIEGARFNSFITTDLKEIRGYNHV